MQSRTTMIAVIIAAAGAGGGFAQTSLPDLEISGQFDVNNLSGNGTDETYYAGLLDLSYGFGSGIGFDLYARAVRLESGDTIDSYFPALTYTFGNNKFSIGNPRSPISELGRQRFFGYSSVIDLEISAINGSLVDTIAILDETTYGLRYDGQFSMIYLAVAYHAVDGEDFETLGLTATYNAGNLSFSIANESARSGSDDTSRTWLTIDGEFGKFDAGLSVSTGSGFVLDDATTADLYVDYKVTDNFTVGIDAVMYDDIFSNNRLASLGAEYSFGFGGFVNGSIVSLSSGSDNIYSVGAGWRF